MTCKAFDKATKVTRMVPVRGSTGVVLNRLSVRKRKALPEHDCSDLLLEFITEVHLSSGDRRTNRRKL
jgi:hypothetical protein